jgi:pseudouridine-5'-phosphate glycosidase
MLRVSPAVSRALASGRAVVALESTIVAHGMPWPRNLQSAQACAAAVRARGAEPATVAVLRGALCVGLSAQELEEVARAGGAGRRILCFTPQRCLSALPCWRRWRCRTRLGRNPASPLSQP